MDASIRIVKCNVAQNKMLDRSPDGPFRNGSRVGGGSVNIAVRRQFNHYERMENRMRSLRNQSILTFVLGVLSLIAGFFSHLALTDIAHGEQDPSLEWAILRISAVIIATFTVLSLATLTRVLKLKL